MNKLNKALNESAFARWSVLILVGFVLSANYYFYDAFSTLKGTLMSEFSFTNTQYGMFVSFYSIPNTFLLMAVIGGIILDRFGIRRTGFSFVFCMALGALLTAYGASDYYSNEGLGFATMGSFLPNYSPQLKMMLLGRFFYGLGAETSIVVISKILVKWFKGRNLALAFGLKVGFGRLGTFAALQLSPILNNGGQSLSTAIWFAAFLVFTGLLVFIVYMLLDAKLDKQIMPVKAKIKDEDKFKFSDIGRLLGNRAFLFIALLCVTFYSAVFPFMAFAPDLFVNKYGLTDVASGRMTSLLPLATLICTPLFGFLIDKYGRSASAMIFGSMTLFLIHISFALTNISPYIPMIMLGIAFSLVPAAMWPSMVRLVDENKIGTAYGMMYSIQNLGLWGFPLIAGWLLDYTNPGNPSVLNYTPTMLMFATLGLLGLFFAFMLKYTDKKRGFGVELPLNTSK